MKKYLLLIIIVCLFTSCPVKPTFAQFKEYGSQNVNKRVFSPADNWSLLIPNNNLIQDGIAGVEMWVYIPTGGLTNGYYYNFVGKGIYPNKYSFTIQQDKANGNTLLFGMNTAVVHNSDGIPLTENAWTHIAVTWLQHDVSYFQIKFYVNGQQSGSTIDQWIIPTYNSDPIQVGMGQGINSPGLYIDEVRFWSSQPSEAEIAANRFIGIGDGAGANSSMSLTNSSSVYKNLISSYTFNYEDGSNSYDDIGGLTGAIPSGSLVQTTYPGQPIPYNLALYLPGSAGMHVSVPSDPIFNSVTSSGTIEAWVFPEAGGYSAIMQKDASAGVSSYCFAIFGSDLYLNIGSGTAHTNGGNIQPSRWSHVAVSWSKFGSNYDVDFYVNGKNVGSGMFAATMDISNSDVWIGASQSNSPSELDGYLDEVRLWSSSRPPDSIKAYMFSSCRNINNPYLLAAYNFDGNLLNYSRYSLPGGTFLLPGSVPNTCRFSGYLNETTTGAFNTSFTAHPTTLNYGNEDNYFKKKFIMSTPNLIIHDNTTGTDSIMISGIPGTVSTVEVMVDYQHFYINDNRITITAPNGVSKIIFNSSGGNGRHLFTVFNDNYALTTSTPGYFAPYTPCVKPDNLMGDFGGSPVSGKWTISIEDGTAGNEGILLGWGLKINDINVGINEGKDISSAGNFSQNYPNPFNSSTNIKFQLPTEDFVSIKIYDVIGKELKTLISENLSEGSHEVRWDASEMQSGTYYYSIETESLKETKKIILIK